MHPLLPPFREALLQQQLPAAEELLQQAQQMARASGSDEDKAVAWEMEGGLLRTRADYSRATIAYEKAIACYKKNNHTAARALVVVQLAGVYYYRSLYRQCVALCRQAMELAETVQHTQALANALQLIGLAQINTGELAAAIQHSHRAIHLNRQLNNPEKEASARQNVAIAYLRMGDYENAMEQLLQAIRIFEEIKLRPSIASCLTQMGNLMKDSGQPEKALHYYTQAHDLHQSLDNQHSQYYAQFNISIMLHQLQRYPEALQATENARLLLPTPHIPKERCRIHLGMASIYMDTGLLAEAEEQCQLAQQLLPEIEDVRLQAYVIGGLGVLYYKSKHFARAKESLLAARTLLLENEMWPDAVNCETHLYEIAETEGDTAAALHHYRQRTQINQRMLDEKIQQRMLLLQMQFETEQKDAELQRLRAEKAALQEQKQSNASNYRLTPREHAILKLLVEGHSYKQMAAELGIAYDTVREHITNLYKKLGVGTNTEAVAKAVKEGLV